MYFNNVYRLIKDTFREHHTLVVETSLMGMWMVIAFCSFLFSNREH